MVTNTEDDEDSQDTINYKAQYRNLKRKLKFLIYENECFQEVLRSTQRRLLKASRDRSFLLDRLLNYEKVEVTSSEGEETESSDDGEVMRPTDSKRRKLDLNQGSSFSASSSSGPPKTPSSAKKKKPPTPKPLTKSLSQPQLQTISKDGHMTSAEVQRHLEEARQQRFLDQAVASIPSDMFSNDPSLDIDSESNELCEMETSPSNLGEDCLSVDMIAE